MNSACSITPMYKNLGGWDHSNTYFSIVGKLQIIRSHKLGNVSLYVSWKTSIYQIFWYQRVALLILHGIGLNSPFYDEPVTRNEFSSKPMSQKRGKKSMFLTHKKFLRPKIKNRAPSATTRHLYKHFEPLNLKIHRVVKSISRLRRTAHGARRTAYGARTPPTFRPSIPKLKNSRFARI